MSAPNNAYDPVEVAVLAPDEVQQMLDDALRAIAAAADLDQLLSLIHISEPTRP